MSASSLGKTSSVPGSLIKIPLDGLFTTATQTKLSIGEVDIIIPFFGLMDMEVGSAHYKQKKHNVNIRYLI